MALLGWALVVGILGIAAGPARAQVEVLTPDMVEKLAPGKERPLALGPDGDMARFAGEPEAWQEVAAPLLLDLDRDGSTDYMVVSLLDAEATRRAVLIYAWGERADVLGPGVFYFILDAQGDVVEWAGSHRLTPRSAPRGSPEAAPTTRP